MHRQVCAHGPAQGLRLATAAAAQAHFWGQEILFASGPAKAPNPRHNVMELDVAACPGIEWEVVVAGAQGTPTCSPAALAPLAQHSQHGRQRRSSRHRSRIPELASSVKLIVSLMASCLGRAGFPHLVVAPPHRGPRAARLPRSGEPKIWVGSAGMTQRVTATEGVPLPPPRRRRRRRQQQLEAQSIGTALCIP